MTIILQMPKTSSLILCIIALAFALRIALVFSVQGHYDRAYEPDTSSYIDPALRLLQGERFIDYGHRTPIYPFFIAFFFGLFGEYALPVIAGQIILSVLIVYMTYVIGKELLSDSAGLVAAFLMTISIESITHAFFLLTETLFIALFLGSILSYVIFKKTQKGSYIFLSGILLGLAILSRPIAAYFPYLFIILILFDSVQGVGERLKKAFIYAVSVSVVIIPWILWNYFTIGIATITTISDYNLLFYNAASLQADRSGLNIEEVRDSLEDRVEQTLLEQNLPVTPENRSVVYRKLAQTIIFADPLRYAYLHLRNDINNFLPGVTDLTEILGITVGGKGTLAVLNKDGLLAAIKHYFQDKVWLIGILAPAILLLMLIYISDLIGAGILVFDKKWFILAIIVLPLLYLMLIPGAPSNQRFRVPAMPFICLLSAHGLIFLWLMTKSIFGSKSPATIPDDPADS